MAITENHTGERPHPHLEQTTRIWDRLQRYRQHGSLTIDGRSLDLAGLVAVARYNCLPNIDKSPEVVQQIEDSVKTLNAYIANGSYLYGVNTGFGGSADVRTTDLAALQVALMQHTQSAVIIESDKSNTVHEQLTQHVMPHVWAKATMLLRANANIRGHSAMTLPVAEAIIELIRRDCTPLIPLRGSISASGDLMPLSYVAGSIMGNPDIHIRMSDEYGGGIVTADQALQILGMKPIVLGPKEGLSLINGTAPSAAVASLCMYEANNLAIVSQALTAMTAEVLAANVEWAHAFISDIRPHQGQIEAAYNVRNFLHGSKLVVGLLSDKDRFKIGLAQERYALRSSPQWLSPILEDLISAQRQLATELNSTSDNPVVNVAQNDVHCGANFQAAAVTLASEKIRSCLQMIGKLIFSQTTEMINNTLNNGLPPNLAADDPSLSFCLKGVDVNMAAYQSELAFLANPVSSHVQSAEMHNQAVNSLALLTSRYTMQAVDLVSLMCAGALYTACQGLDLRVMHMTFLRDFRPTLDALITKHLRLPVEQTTTLSRTLFTDITTSWYATSCLDAHERTSQAACSTIPSIVDFISAQPNSTSNSFKSLQTFKTDLAQAMLAVYLDHRESFFATQSTVQYLATSTARLYCFIRNELGVPFHRGLIDQPSPFDTDPTNANGSRNGLNVGQGKKKKIIGSWVSIIYEAIRDGKIIECILSERPSTPSGLNGHSNGTIINGKG